MRRRRRHGGVVPPLATNVAGDLEEAFVLPATTPVGTTFFVQFWIRDSSATLGVAASDAVQGVTL